VTQRPRGPEAQSIFGGRATYFNRPFGLHGDWYATTAEYGLPRGIARVALHEHPDGRCYVTPDGGWNHSPAPLVPSMTYDEAVRFFSNCSVMPAVCEVCGDEPEDPEVWRRALYQKVRWFGRKRKFLLGYSIGLYTTQEDP